MDFDKMGIVVSMIVLVTVLGVAAVSSGDFDIGTGEVKLPYQINAGTNTATPNAYYEWCYQMGKTDC